MKKGLRKERMGVRDTGAMKVSKVGVGDVGEVWGGAWGEGGGVVSGSWEEGSVFTSLALALPPCSPLLLI